MDCGLLDQPSARAAVHEVSESGLYLFHWPVKPLLVPLPLPWYKTCLLLASVQLQRILPYPLPASSPFGPCLKSLQHPPPSNVLPPHFHLLHRHQDHGHHGPLLP